MRFRAALVVAVLMALPAAGAARQRPVVRTEPTPPLDVFSAAELADVRTRHLALDLEIDFDVRRLRGSATHAILNLTGTDRFVLDTRDLEIIAVTVDGHPATWSHGTASPAGRALTIPIEPSTRSVRIDYETRGDAGLLFFEPLQTDGDLAPFFFTFGQPDRTREWIPVQDTPGARMTYEATIRVPPGLVALMSARNATTSSPDGVYRFEMPLPIPPYLIALAAGRVAFHPLSARTGIWAEPERLADAAYDLSYIPAMLLVAEEMIGPYPYERYDVILLPAGYSAGGMENPMLNFINVASVVRGNGETPPVPHRLIAHELAHSWAGDTVTCATWGDLWLNEGFASYYTNRILEAMRGADYGDHGFYLDRSSFEEYAASTTDDALEVLHRELSSGDDLAIFTPTVYSKGSIFLKMLEDRMGRPVFDAFARSWFLRYAYRWADVDAFRDHLEPFVAPGVSLQLDAWLHEPGLPSNVTAPDRSIVIDRIAEQALAFRQGTPARSLDTASWTSYEHGIFLSLLGTDLAPRLAELDASFGYSAGVWPPAVAWVVAVAERLYGPGLPLVERFLRSGTWSVIAVYGWLAQNPLRREWAITTYERMRPHYVEGIRMLVDEILGLEASALEDAA